MTAPTDAGPRAESPDRLAALTGELADAAARLREETLTPEEASALTEECARIATDAAAELEARVRAAGA